MLPFDRCIFLTGPTASGKTALGIEVARRIRGEILSMDSMAIYRGMDIGTAKPTAEERAAAPHHLLDFIEPTRDFSVAEYLAAAEAKAREIEARGRTPIFVGGTPLYLKALLRGLFDGPPKDEALRRRLLERAQEEGPEKLHERLAAVDPTTAERLHGNDVRRVVRALEVYETTGRPISEWQQQHDQPRGRESLCAFALLWPREELHARIDRRVDAMFAAGLIDETRGLLARHGQLGPTASQAAGYRQVIAHVRGDLSLEEAIQQTKIHHRQLAKRQMTWMRGLEELRPLPITDGDPRSHLDTIVDSLACLPRDFHRQSRG